MKLKFFLWKNYLSVFKQWEKKKKIDKSTIVAPLPRDPDKRKKKEKPTTGRVRILKVNEKTICLCLNNVKKKEKKKIS